MYIHELNTKRKVECSIELMKEHKTPRKRNGWLFNWAKALRENPESTFVLISKREKLIQGAIQISYDEGMLIMEILELAPHNIGKQKKFKNVAGCLIAFACREAIKLNSAYKGYVTFLSKTELINWYKEKYFATQAMGQRMYIDPINGQKLIKNYIKE